jgi:putative transcriptional regulator
MAKLNDLFYAHRMTLSERAERVGLTLANLSVVKTGKAKAIRFSTLAAICRELAGIPAGRPARPRHRVNPPPEGFA